MAFSSKKKHPIWLNLSLRSEVHFQILLRCRDLPEYESVFSFESCNKLANGNGLYSEQNLSEHLQHAKKLFQNILRELGPLHSFIQDPFNLILKNIRSHIEYHSAGIAKANLAAANYRTTMTNKIQATFQQCVDDASASRLIPNSMPRRQPAWNLPQLQQSQPSTATNGRKCECSQTSAHSSDANSVPATNVEPVQKRTRLEEDNVPDDVSQNMRFGVLATGAFQFI